MSRIGSKPKLVGLGIRILHQLDDALHGDFGIFRLDEVEVGIDPGQGGSRE